MKKANCIVVLLWIVAIQQQLLGQGLENIWSTSISKPIMLGKQWFYTKDSTRELTIHTIRNVAKEKFQPCDNERYTSDFEPCIFWFRTSFEYTGVEEKEVLFEVDNPHINRMRFFILESDSLQFQSDWMGDYYPFQNRFFEHKDFLFPFVVKPGYQYTFYLQIDMRNEVLMLTNRLWPERAYINAKSFEDILFGFIFGVMFIFFIIALSLFYANRNWSSFYYVCYTLGMSLLVIGYSGYGFQLFYQDYPYLNNIARPFFLGMSTIFFTLFARSFLEIKQNLPISYTITSVLIIFLCLYIFVGLFYQKFSPATAAIIIKNYYFIIITIYLMVLYWCFYAFVIQRHRNGLLFVMAYGLLGFSILLNVLVLNNKIPLNFFTGNIFYLAAVSEVLCMTLFLGYNFAIIKNRNREMLLSISQLKNKSLQNLIEGEEKERKRLAGELHDGISFQIANVTAGLKSYFNNNKANPKDLISKLDNISENIRNISHNLYPPHLREGSLIDVIESNLHRLNHYYADITFRFRSNSSVSFSDFQTLYLFRIYQEIVKNIIQHAQATLVDVVIVEDENFWTLSIRDNGIGFNLNEKEKGLGLVSLQNRIKVLNGKMDIQTKRNQGTLLMVSIPLSNKILLESKSN